MSAGQHDGGAGARVADDAAAAILYNGDCPICRFEVDHHKARAARMDLPVRFDDLNAPDRAAWGVDADAAARRLHVRTGDGRLVTGWEANLAMWRAMPGWGPLARVAGAPGVNGALRLIYDRVFAPLVYRLHRRRQARRAAGGR